MTAPEAPTMSNTLESKCNPLRYTNAAEVAYHHTTDDALSHGLLIKASEEPKLIPTSLHEIFPVFGVLRSSLCPDLRERHWDSLMVPFFFIPRKADEAREDVGEEVSVLLLVCFRSSA
jgi:hypothetical protein